MSQFINGPDLPLIIENRQLKTENTKLKNELSTKTIQQPPQLCHNKIEDKTGIRVTYCMLDKGHKGVCK